MKILSGAQLPQPNAYIVERDEGRILLDFGATRGKTLDVPDVDAALFTHAHWDHCGGLVSLVEARIPCFATPETARFISFVLKPVVGKDRARAISDTLVQKRFHESFKIGDFSCELLPSGHMDGAAMIHVKSVDRSILYTGDFSIAEQTHCVPAATVPACDLLLCESSLINLRVADGDLEDNRHELQTLSSGLIVGRAVGDLHEVVELLNDVDVSFIVHENTAIGGALEQSEFVRRVKGGEIGLIAGELSQDSASWGVTGRLLQDPEMGIHLLNGVSRTPIGRRLLQTTRRSKVTISGQTIRLRARVYPLSLRSHASRHELIDWLRPSLAKKIVLVHGPEDGQRVVAGKLREKGLDVVVGRDGDVY